MKQLTKEQEENAELKADNDARKFAMAMSEKVEKKLRQENKNAKEIIKNLLVYVPVDLKEYEEAKQFTSEVEK